MKKVIFLLSIVVILPFFALNCYADDGIDKFVNDFKEALPEEYKEFGETDKLTDAADFGTLVSVVEGVITEGKADFLKFLFLLIGSATLLAVASLCPGKLSGAVECGAGIVCSVTVFSAISPIIDTVSSEIDKISGFFASLIPITVGITAFGGGVATASVQAVGMYTALSAVGGIADKIFLSLSAFGLAMAMLSSFNNEGIGAVCKGLKGLFNWVTGIFTALLTAAFSLQTLIASSADNAAMRAAKYAASGLIPVVGSTVSGAISTLASGLSYAKGIVGGGAIAVILYMSITPLALLLLYRLGLSLCIILTDFMGIHTGSRIFTSFRFALDMMITVYALSALIYLFEIIIVIRTGVALL